MVTTNDGALAERLRMLRVHGSKVKYDHEIVGGNFRLDALQAAIISVKLKHLDAWTASRQRNAARYGRLFAEAGIAPEPVRLPPLPAHPGDRHVFNQYVVRVPERDALRAFIGDLGVRTEVYYPIPLHRQTCFAELGLGDGAFPESERASRETLALPIYPELDDAQAAHVVDSIRRFVQRPS
jgi:dTDP-4-amino-4,6-dideoxygalactose transaminase